MTAEEKTLEEELIRKILVLDEVAWEGRVKGPRLNDWLQNFSTSKEKIYALFLISQFMYFGSDQIRALLKALFRDLYKYPKIESIRRSNSDTLDNSTLDHLFYEHLKKTRFLGLGNPSESGVHMLYFFRQENRLPKRLFIHSYQIFQRNVSTGTFTLENPRVEHYVFLDDFCGSGRQAIPYAKRIVEDMKNLNSSIKVEYLSLFATVSGKQHIRNEIRFDNVDSVFELDESFRCFEQTSRYFHNSEPLIEKDFTREFCELYGKNLMKIICELEGTEQAKISECAERNALGYEDGQLLIGFHHNTPDNTLPIIWFDEGEHFPWIPIFRRYNKKYGF